MNGEPPVGSSPGFKTLLSRVKRALLLFLDLIGLYSCRTVDREARLTRSRLDHVEFRVLLTANNSFLTIVSEMEENRLSDLLPHPAWVKKQVLRAAVDVHRMIKSLDAISDQRYPQLAERYRAIAAELSVRLEGVSSLAPSSWILDLSEIRSEHAWLVGGKMGNLGEIRNAIGLPTPPGFAITADAHQSMIREYGIMPGPNGRGVEGEKTGEGETTRRPQGLEIPDSFQEAILDAYDHLHEDLGCPPRVAVRSSAVGEDGVAHTFTGQFLTVLNVTRDGLIDAYRRVVESLFSEGAVHYRQIHHLPPNAMPVGVLCMVDAVASGVVYTADPSRPESRVVLVHVVKGLGSSLVDGRTSPETILFEREPELRIAQRKGSPQDTMVVTEEGGGVREVRVPAELASTPSLTDEETLSLARMAVAVEAHFGGPQDIEWAMDAERRLWVLQSRPLRVAASKQEEVSRRVEGRTVLLEGGDASFPGVGCGPVVRMDEEGDMSRFPEGAVLVAPRSSPRFVRLMGKASAIVTDFGGVTGHMAALTRELHVPALLNTRVATKALEEGVIVTVDARAGRVYQGSVEELLEAESDRAREADRLRQEPSAPAYHLIESVSRLVLPLHLVDPHSPGFSPENCQTLHDIARFVHEKSYEEMFRIGEHLGDLRGVSRQLDVFLPIDLYVIDLGEGIDAPPGTRKLKISNIVSTPLRALLAGMLDKRIPRFGPRPMDLRGLMTVMARHAATNPEQERTFRDPCYALISDRYLNYTARVGYHFGVVDAYCGETVNKNYVSILFRGGAADFIRRHRRARAIGTILERHGFSSSVRGDAVTARLSKRSMSETAEQLEMVGRLFQFFRQMDAAMNSEAAAVRVQEAFIRGEFALDGEPTRPPSNMDH